MSVNFTFDDWITENELDKQISDILKKEKLITVQALLGLQEQEMKDLFDGYPKGYLTSFRFAKNLLSNAFTALQNTKSKHVVGR